MEIPVVHAQFRAQRLAVRTAGWFSGPKVLLNGAVLKKAKGVYSARADDGREVPIRVNVTLGDPVPKLRIGDDTVHLAKPLQWYEYAWAACPIVLLFVGGALGAIAGILGSYCNFRIFRSDRGGMAKFALSGATTLATAIVFFVVVVFLRLALGR